MRALSWWHAGEAGSSEGLPLGACDGNAAGGTEGGCPYLCVNAAGERSREYGAERRDRHEDRHASQGVVDCGRDASVALFDSP
jgi:hypothetical protein